MKSPLLRSYASAAGPAVTLAGRRSFLFYGGASVALGSLWLAGCKPEEVKPAPVVPAPTLTSVSPGAGAPGTTVTLTGTNFISPATVRLGTIEVTFTLVSATTITFVVPAVGNLLAAAISVTTPGGTAGSPQPFTILPPASTITSFTPGSGLPGTTVTLTGTNFSGATGVTLGGVATVFTVVNATTITLTVPATAVTGNFVVTTPGGTGSSAAAFTVLPEFINVGTGDLGVLNYLYGLEQLQAAFYARVELGAYYSGAALAEKAALHDITGHAVVHSEFLRLALGNQAIKTLDAEFAAVNFADRTAVLTTARTLKDLSTTGPSATFPPPLSSCCSARWCRWKPGTRPWCGICSPTTPSWAPTWWVHPPGWSWPKPRLWWRRRSTCTWPPAPASTCPAWFNVRFSPACAAPMNLYHLLTELEAVDPEVYARFDGRRRVFRHLGAVGRRLTAAAVPAVASALFNRAYGQTGSLPGGIAYALNLALEFEYLELNFYNQALSSTGLSLSADNRAAITLVRNDEANHVQTLRAILGSQAQAPLPANAYDFTGGKGGQRAPAFPGIFTNAATFLAVAQTLEDLGVRAYKGHLPTLFANKAVLEVALNIHSVEARHSSHLRTMRRGGTQSPPSNDSNAAPKSWIYFNDNGGPVPTVFASVYGPGNPVFSFPSEENVTQNGTQLPVVLNGLVTGALTSEAFDEPLDAVTVTAIAGYFRI
jgi:hypothetical protein